MRVNAAALSKALLADMADEIDVQLPSWAPDSTPREVACYALRDSFMKKFMETDEPSPTACAAALKKFIAVNTRCKSWVIPYEFSQDDVLVGELKRTLHEFWYRDESPLVNDYRDLFLRGRAGPGASISARDTDFYTKMFDSDLSCTATIPQIWERCYPLNGLWAEAEAFRSTIHGINVVEHSNYSFVNKTTTIARGICTEPSLNMWLQLGLGSVLETRIRECFGIDLALQPDINRELARRGSIEGQLCTVDLESASDSMALNVLEELLPRSFMGVLKTLRTPRTRLPDGSEVELHMVSTMGNGFTFPLQTMLFASVVKSVYRYLGLNFLGRGLASGRTFSVFGDDIIVDKRAIRLVLRLLHLLGFVVNNDKTFVEGRFRESCGADYVDGVNVRGVYCKRLRSEQDLFTVINGLNRWTAKTGVPVQRTIELLVSGVRSPRRNFVPPDEDDAAGIHSPVEYARANNYRSTRIGLIQYHPRLPRAWEFIVIGGCVWTYKEQVRRNYNPSGLLISFLAGSIRGYRVTLRQRVVRYTTKRKWTPNWGYMRPRPLEGLSGPSGCRRFVDACNRNFVNSGFGG